MTYWSTDFNFISMPVLYDTEMNLEIRIFNNFSSYQVIKTFQVKANLLYY